MKKLLFAGIAVSMLAACSSDEVVPVNNDSNAIKFSTTTENGTRAADINCPNHFFEQFNVVAAYGSSKYINGDGYGDVIVKNGTAWDNQSGLRYWPETGNLNFYAYVIDEEQQNKFTWAEVTTDEEGKAIAPQFKDYEINDKVGSQFDLMYATKTDSKKTTAVNLNFRHALSQVVFQAKNTNKNLYVEVEGVSVVNVKNKGTYTLPTADTDGQIIHPGDADNTSAARGTWSETLEGNAKYDVTFTAVELEGNSAIKSLTTYSNDLHKADADKDAYKAAVANAMILLPQTTAKVNLTGITAADLTAAKEGIGAYFLVKCKMWNVAGSTFNKETDVVIWPRKGETEEADPDDELEAAYVLIPVDIAWEQGKKYTYTFTFGNGAGGTDPENPGDDVLYPITFAVTVDEFVSVDGGDYDINGNPVTSEEEEEEEVTE